MNHALWDHQVETLANLKASVAQGCRRIVVQAPTGSGKTILAAAIVEGALQKGNRLAFVVSSISLIDQTVEKLWREGIKDVGVIQAKHSATDWSKPIQVCSVQTLAKRAKFPEAKVVVIDECHVLYETQKRWLEHPDWQQVPFIGLSATPWTKGLGKYFNTLLIAATTQELIDKGLLSKFRVFATGHPDLSRVRTVAGDYHEGDLSGAMQAGTLTADIVRTWQERWGQDRTLCFGVDCAHAQALQKRFQEAGINAAYQDAHTSDEDRRAIKEGFHKGIYRVVCNVGTLTTGVDWDVRCLILARPTKSEMLYVQIIGRALRTAADKEHAVILDHSTTTAKLGFVTDIHHDYLHDGKEKDKAERKVPLPKPCPGCQMLKPPRMRICPHCGHEAAPPTNVIYEGDGELIEVTPGRPLKKAPLSKRAYTMDERREWYAQLIWYAGHKGYKEGWAGHKYRERFGEWPRGMGNVVPQVAGQTVRDYIRSRQIAWERTKEKEGLPKQPMLV